jgi:hypothetical protein
VASAQGGVHVQVDLFANGGGATYTTVLIYPELPSRDSRLDAGPQSVRVGSSGGVQQPHERWHRKVGKVQKIVKLVKDVVVSVGCGGQGRGARSRSVLGIRAVVLVCSC